MSLLHDGKYDSIESELQKFNLDEEDIKEILNFINEKVEAKILQEDPETREMENQLRKSINDYLKNESVYVDNLNTLLKVSIS